MGKAMSTSIGTVTQVSIEAVEKEKRSKKVVMNIQQNTTDAARATQVERQVEKKTYTHDTDSEIQANTRNVCEGDRSYDW